MRPDLKSLLDQIFSEVPATDEIKVLFSACQCSPIHPWSRNFPACQFPEHHLCESSRQQPTSILFNAALTRSHLRQIPRSSLARSDSLPESIRISVSWRPHWCSPLTITMVTTVASYNLQLQNIQLEHCHCCHHFIALSPYPLP